MAFKESPKLGLLSGVYIPVCLNILSILMFLRFGLILGQIGLLGMLGLLILAYGVDLLTTLSLSAIASNGEVRGGGAYYLISRSLGPEFGGSIGILFFLAQVLNTALNIVGLLDCIRLNVVASFPQGYWFSYALETAALLMCTGMCLLGPGAFAKASNLMLAILTVAVVSIPLSVAFKAPFINEHLDLEYTGPNLSTLASNFLPSFDKHIYRGLVTFRNLFGILFSATSGIFAGASMSGDLRNPSQAIPIGTLWAVLTTFIIYSIVVLCLACTVSRDSLLANANIVSLINLSSPVILAGECAVTLFSALMGIIGSANLLQALARDRLLPGMSVLGRGTRKTDQPLFAVMLTYLLTQIALLADLNQIATLISMGYQMTFFVTNLACFLLKIGSAPNFRPSFKFFTWYTAFLGSVLSAAAMFFIDETYAAAAICILISIFLLIHYSCPPKRWGDVSQNLIYHQVRKYLLLLKAEHIKFWRPHILLLVNDPRRQTRLIRFCNSLKKGSLYILGHVIVTEDFDAGVREARLQQHAWTRYILEFSRIKAFVQLTMSPSFTWGVRNLVLSAGLGGMRPNIVVIGSYNLEELRKTGTSLSIPDVPDYPASKMIRPRETRDSQKGARKRRRGDTSSRLLEDALPTDYIRSEGTISPTDYMVMLEDLALKYKLNVAVAQGFDELETPRDDGFNTKKYIDLWPIQMSAEISAQGQSALTTNFDTYTLILQLGHILRSVHAWRRNFIIRVMVFVEYEHEVEEERAQVQALLEKLRIDAKVLVFHLASGLLDTYELIINGKTNNIDAEIVVREALKNEAWWEDLQTIRGQTEENLTSQEMSQLAHIFDPSIIGGFNPHEEASDDRRRQSLRGVTEVPRKPDLATIARLGVNISIHTTRIIEDVLRESQSDTSYDSDTDQATDDEALVSSTHTPFQTRTESRSDPTSRPLIPRPSMDHAAATMNTSHRLQIASSRSTKQDSVLKGTSSPSYGTLSSPQTIVDQLRAPTNPKSPEGKAFTASPRSPADQIDEPRLELFPQLEPLSAQKHPADGRKRSHSFSASHSVTPRPGFSRHTSAIQFPSRPVAGANTTPEGEVRPPSFAPSATISAASQFGRPGFSRQTSFGGKFSSRVLPETKVSGEEGARTISFACQPNDSPHLASRPRPAFSRQGSRYSQITRDGKVSSIPEYAMRATYEEVTPDDTTDCSTSSSDHDLSLSFNDLPCRAQHLILNELMRSHSRETAVVMSTLPIPSEGTSTDETSTIQYLSDVELFCNALPPMLMILSNSMTVTVNL